MFKLQDHFPRTVWAITFCFVCIVYSEGWVLKLQDRIPGTVWNCSTYTLSNFKITHDVTSGRLHPGLHTPPRVTIKRVVFCLDSIYYTHILWYLVLCHTHSPSYDITSNLEVGQSVAVFCVVYSECLVNDFVNILIFILSFFVNNIFLSQTGFINQHF